MKPALVNESFWIFQKPDPLRIPILQMPNCSVTKFRHFLQTSFAEISRKQCKTLIIDLRNNDGGEDGNGAALFSCLTNKPIAVAGTSRQPFFRRGLFSDQWLYIFRGGWGTRLS